MTQEWAMPLPFDVNKISRQPISAAIQVLDKQIRLHTEKRPKGKNF